MKRSTFLSRVAATAAACAVATAGLTVISAAPSGAAAKAPISIGYICSCTSPQASSVVINRSAYEAYVDYTNAHGGIAGHKIKLYLADDSANPATSTADVHTFVTQDHVQAIVSLAGSPAVMAKVRRWPAHPNRGSRRLRRPVLHRPGLLLSGTDG